MIAANSYSEIKTRFNRIPFSTPHKIILPLMLFEELEYNSLPLYSKELTAILDVSELENILKVISKSVNFSKRFVFTSSRIKLSRVFVMAYSTLILFGKSQIDNLH